MNRVIFVISLLGVFVTSAPALAAGGEDCTAIDDPDARLACYDRQFDRTTGNRGVEGVERAETAEEATPPGVDMAAPAEAQKQTPAIAPVISSQSVPQEPEPAGEAPASGEPGKAGLFSQDEKVELTSTITHVHAKAQQKMLFQLENNQVWMQSTPRLLRISEGDRVTIENASIGGYMMRTDRGVTTRVERVR